MTYFDIQLSAILGDSKADKKKLTAQRLQRVVELIEGTENIEDSDIVTNTETFKNLIWDELSNQSNDYYILVTAAIITAIIRAGTLLRLNDVEKSQSFLVRLHQIYEKKTTTIDQKILILKLVTSVTLNIQDSTTQKAIAPLFSALTLGGIEIKEADIANAVAKEKSKTQNLPPKERNIITVLSSWIPSIIHDFIRLSPKGEPDSRLLLTIMVLISTVLSQLPTRRFILTLVNAKRFLFHARNKFVETSTYLTALDTLEYFVKFPVNEFSGEAISPDEQRALHSEKLERFQTILFTHFKTQLELSFCSSKQLQDSAFVESQLNSLDDDSLAKLLSALGITVTTHRDQNIKLVLFILEKPMTLLDQIERWSVNPSLDELKLIDEDMLHYLPPRGMYLCLNDLILRNYQSYRIQALYKISKHIVTTASRFEKKKNQSKLTGNSRHAVKLSEITHITSHTGGSHHYTIKIEINSQDSNHVKEWNDIKVDDLAFIAKLKIGTSSSKLLVDRVDTLHPSKVSAVLNNNGSPKTSNNSKSFTLEVVSKDEVSMSEFDPVIFLKLPPNIQIELQKIRQYVPLISHNTEESLPVWLVHSLLSGKAVKPEISANFKKLTLNGQSLDSKLLEVTSPGRYEGVPPDPKKRRTETSTNTTELKKPVLGLLDQQQTSSLLHSLDFGLNLINGVAHTGKRTIVAHLIEALSSSFSNEKILIIAKHKYTLSSVLQKLDAFSLDYLNISDESDLLSRADAKWERLSTLLKLVDVIASELNLEGAFGNDSETALTFFKYNLNIKWISFLTFAKTAKSTDDIVEAYPFKNLSAITQLNSVSTKTELLKTAISNFVRIKKIFDEIKILRPLEYLQTSAERVEYLLNSHFRVVGAAYDDLLKPGSPLRNKARFETIIFIDASEFDTLETIYPLLKHGKETIKRVTLVGDETRAKLSYLNKTGDLFQKFLSNCPSDYSLKNHFIKRELITTCLNDLTTFSLINQNASQLCNPGLLEVTQMIEINGDEEMEHLPGFYQNVTEAEYAVLLYQYLRLVGYPQSKIVILTPFEGQKILLAEVAETRCSDSSYEYGIPLISTIDQLDNQDFEIVIGSLVRTKESSFTKHELSSLLSSGLSGVYCLGSKETIKSLKKDGLLESLLARSTTLEIIPTEKYDKHTRKVRENVKSVRVPDTERLFEELEKLSANRATEK